LDNNQGGISMPALFLYLNGDVAYALHLLIIL